MTRCLTTKKSRAHLPTGRRPIQPLPGQNGTSELPVATNPTSSPATMTRQTPPRTTDDGSTSSTVVPICPGPLGTRAGGTGTTMKERPEEPLSKERARGSAIKILSTEEAAL